MRGPEKRRGATRLGLPAPERCCGAGVLICNHHHYLRRCAMPPAPRPPIHCARRAIRMQSERIPMPMLTQTAKAHPSTRTPPGRVTQRTHVRCASHAAGAEARTPRELERQRYPFPAHANPTPREIFHLPPGASQAQIKERCELFLRCYLYLHPLPIPIVSYPI